MKAAIQLNSSQAAAGRCRCVDGRARLLLSRMDGWTVKGRKERNNTQQLLYSLLWRAEEAGNVEQQEVALWNRSWCMADGRGLLLSVSEDEFSDDDGLPNAKLKATRTKRAENMKIIFCSTYRGLALVSLYFFPQRTCCATQSIDTRAAGCYPVHLIFVQL